ncbi:hypothetical protein ACFVTX_08045 [Agromyces sp. NPDC058136]|uniref:hypothetical protein n=1 Tax=Agromyces sp. NPDC058136 TaxID=3346354 RepID=UPI0036DAC077
MLPSAEVIDILDPIPGLVFAGEVDGRRTFAAWRDGAVRLLDDRLAEVAHRKLSLAGDARVLAASGLDLVVIAAAGGVTIVEDDEVDLLELPADAAAIVNGLLVITAPENEVHRVLLLDRATGAVLDEQTAQVDDARAALYPHPNDGTAVLEMALGQDGTLVYRVDVEESRLRLTAILEGDDPVIAGFSPSGDRLLVVDDPSALETVRALTWPGLDALSRVEADEVDAEYGFGLAGCWIDDDRVAFYATEDSLIVATGDLGSPERVELPIAFGDDGEIESLTPLGRGGVAVGAWTPAGRLTLVVEFAEAEATESLARTVRR